jgi:hypothetical protein
MNILLCEQFKGTKSSFAFRGNGLTFAKILGALGAIFFLISVSHANDAREPSRAGTEGTMAKTLREQLVGTWHLVSYVERPTDGSASFYPLGEHPEGMIFYTPDGYVSAQLQRSGRHPSGSHDMLDHAQDGTISYVGYSGTYQIDENQQQVTHFISISFLPNLLGSAIARTVRIEGDFLYIGTAKPINLGGKESMPQLVWKRATHHDR